MTSVQIAEQQLSRIAEHLFIGSVDHIKAIMGSLAESPELRERIACTLRDYWAAHLRPELRRFTGLMEMKLRKHDPQSGVRGWTGNPPTFHLNKIEAILEELRTELQEGRKVGLKAADIANHAMIIADLAGELGD